MMSEWSLPDCRNLSRLLLKKLFGILHKSSHSYAKKAKAPQKVQKLHKNRNLLETLPESACQSFVLALLLLFPYFMKNTVRKKKTKLIIFHVLFKEKIFHLNNLWQRGKN